MKKIQCMNGRRSKRFWVLCYALHVVLDLAKYKRFTLKKTEYWKYNLSPTSAYRTLKHLLEAGMLRKVGAKSYCVDDSVKENLAELKQELKLRRAEKIYRILNSGILRVNLNSLVKETVRIEVFKALGLLEQYKLLKIMEKTEDRLRQRLLKEKMKEGEAQHAFYQV